MSKCDVTSAADFEDSDWSNWREREERKKTLRSLEKFREIFTGKLLERPRDRIWGYGTRFGE